MADYIADVIDVLDIVELSGTRHTNREVEELALAVELSGFRAEEKPRQAVLRAEVTLAKPNEDGSDASIFYTGVVQYFMVLKEGQEAANNDTLAELIWPHMRTALTGHARVLGMQSMKLPLGIRPGDVDQSAPSWLAKQQAE